MKWFFTLLLGLGLIVPTFSQNITHVEYFFDTDLGNGKNRLIAVTAGVDISRSINIPLTGVSPGFHLLYLRARDAAGVFSLTQQRLVYVVPPDVNDQITAIEYFFDTDLGNGKNRLIAITAGEDITRTVTIPLSGISPGYHLLYLRTRDAQGAFSHTQQRIVYVQPNQTLANITKLEYFYVNGTTVSATSTYMLPVPAPNPEIIIPASVNGLTNGLPYTLYIWATNARGVRSLVYSRQFTYKASPLADMTIKRGTPVVPNGGTSNLGSITIGSGSPVAIFTIESVGNATLTLTGIQRVAITGTNASEFTVVQPVVSSLLPTASTTFSVTIKPAGSGIRTAILRIASNSPYEVPYIINLTGTGNCPVIATPTTLTAVSASPTQINLTWTDNATNESAYLVERALAVNGPFTEIATLAANTTTFANTGLVTNTPYYYRVRAKGISTCTSAYSTVSTATPNGAPIAPSILTATAVSVNRIDLAWKDNANNESAYLIERALAAIGPFTQIATLAANATTFANTGLEDARTYFYRVRANNLAGNSPYSNVASPLTPCKLPVAPIGLSATATSSSQISLNWIDESSDETGFLVERSVSATGSFTQIAILPANTNGFVNNGLFSNTIYYYRVRASRACGNSAYSNVSRANTSTALTSLRINCGGTAFITGSGRSFTADAGFAGNTTVGTVATAILGTTDDALYQAQRRSAATPSNFAYNLTAAIGNYTLRLYFAETQFTSIGQRVFSVNVEGVPILTNYDIVADVGVATASIKIFNIRSDGTVNINFTNVTNFATISAIELIPAGANRLADPTLTDKPVFESTLGIHPNPFNNNVLLSFLIPETSPVTLEVFDMQGALIEQLFTGEAEAALNYSIKVNTRLWHPGMYLVRLTTKDKVVYNKMILAR